MSWLNKIPYRLSFDDTWSDTKRTVSWGLILLLLSGISTAYGQQLDQVGQSKALQLSGGLSANQIFYAMHGSDARRDPYTYFSDGRPQPVALRMERAGVVYAVEPASLVSAAV